MLVSVCVCVRVPLSRPPHFCWGVSVVHCCEEPLPLCVEREIIIGPRNEHTFMHTHIYAFTVFLRSAFSIPLKPFSLSFEDVAFLVCRP